MGTHDESNTAGPQNEFLSGFKLGVSHRNKETQPSNVTKSGKADAGIGSVRLSSGPQKSDPFERIDGAGIVGKLRARFMGKESAPGAGRQKIMVVMIPVLFVIMVFMFRQVLSKPPKKAKGEDHNSKTVITNKSSGAEIDWQKPEPLPVTLRDPIKLKESTPEITLPETTSARTEDDPFHVKSILLSSDKPSAVIGNKIVYLNQKINGVTIAEIHKDYITFEKDGKQWTQTISDEAGRGKTEANDPETSGTNMTGDSDK
jgi:hypothetical protein